MPTEPCPICGHRLPREFLSTHLMRAHPDSAGGKEENAASAAPPSGAYQGDLASGLAAPDHVTSPSSENAGPVPTAEEVAASAPPPPAEGAPAAEEAPSTPAVDPFAAPGSPEPVASESAPAEAPAAEAATSAAMTEAGSAAPAAAAAPALTTKDLHAWIAKQRRRTQRSLESAQALCDSLAVPRRSH